MKLKTLTDHPDIPEQEIYVTPQSWTWVKFDIASFEIIERQIGALPGYGIDERPFEVQLLDGGKLLAIGPGAVRFMPAFTYYWENRTKVFYAG